MMDDSEGLKTVRAFARNHPDDTNPVVLLLARHSDALEAERDALSARVAALTEALRVLVDTDPLERHSSSDYLCHYCEGRHWRHGGVQHEASCPWALARALLAEGDTAR